MGRTHLKIGVLYYLLLAWVSTSMVVPFFKLEVTLAAIIAAAIGSLFPDADEDHSLINSKNPIFKASNKAIKYANLQIKKIVGFIFFITPVIGIMYHINKIKRLPRGLVLIGIIFIILAFNSLKVGRYTPILSQIFKCIDSGANAIRKLFMVSIYVFIGAACIYYTVKTDSPLGMIWGAIFIAIAIFPHRTFLHAPEGLILSTVGVKFLGMVAGRPNIYIPFMIGYITHLYLADIFTNSGVPLSSLPIIFKKLGIHDAFNKNKLYKKLYNLLDARLKIPIMSTGSKLGNLIEWSYVVGMAVLVGYIYFYI